MSRRPATVEGRRRPPPPDPVPRNEKGGVLVTDEEIEAAFEFLDVKGKGVVGLQDLITRLSPFYRDMPLREYRFLLGGAEKDDPAKGGGGSWERRDGGEGGGGGGGGGRRRRKGAGGEAGIGLEELKELLRDNDLTGFDPVAEAFKVYDPAGTGYADPAALRDVFRRLGFGDLSDDDMAVLLATADKDKDGKIGIDDFRRIIQVPGGPKEEDTDEKSH